VSVVLTGEYGVDQIDGDKIIGSQKQIPAASAAGIFRQALRRPAI
jgi:hypothetical protein